MQVTTTTVTFRKQVSDGRYGSETAEVTLTVELDAGPPGMGLHDQVEAALDLARSVVHTQLSASVSEEVRRAVQSRAQREAAAKAQAEEHGLEELPF